MADIDIPPGEPEAMAMGCLCQSNEGGRGDQFPLAGSACEGLPPPRSEP